MKKVISIILMMTMVFVLSTGCSSDSGSEQPAETPADVENNKLVMYTNAEFAPFEYFEGEKVVGVDPDIVQEIANEMGKELVIEHTDFDSLIPSLVAGKADLVAAGMTINPERAEEVDFSIPYVESIQNIISKNDAEITTMEDLEGKKIGVQLGTTGDLAISDAVDLEDGDLYNTGAEVKTYANALEAAQDLLNGRIDAVIVDEMPAEEIVKNNSEELVTCIFGEISEQYGIAVEKGNTELLEAVNKTLQKLLDEGKIEELIAKHSN
ncbi:MULTISPECIES: basic amino acid ABC transporter substrate-binding protein [unclassified Sedimentibacter]|uniref:basic amino acid ABC transporter substrate-binding protein n=1 Tax=unclassified Sedimentibacter TaxID=2649220 RepID=UPI0027E105D8|nr:basic amino acid ABC transporter substrate-binding protein [Sedimentibacter sp. MB35-C1]WMJ78924.1 basic amino acid ABC transporter substrate-binding protein [Sedimentibacter sp. MB35-C1]